MRFLTCLFLFLITMMVMPTTGTAEEISFWETFALSTDRDKALEELVPGSPDYFFFHCLHYQNQQKLDEVDALLKKWIKRHGRNKQVQLIENRQGLLVHSTDAPRTIKYLQRQLNLQFNHQQKIPQAQKNLPTALKPDLIDLEKLVGQALRRQTNALDSFEDDGLLALVGKPINARQRRDLLRRIKNPAFTDVVDLIAQDLKGKDATKFGAIPIHRQLTLAQLEELAEKIPDLKSQEKYVDEVLLRMQPSADDNERVDADVYRQHLDRLLKYTQGLSPAFNSIKANVLYRRLELDQATGKYDKALFSTYLALPRQASYTHPDLRDGVNRRFWVVLTDNFQKLTRLLPVGNDERLVSDYLQHFLTTARDTSAFSKWFERDYLKRQFATAKILAGTGDRADYASMLTPEEYKNLLERIDLDFAPTNKEFFATDDAVELELFVKNIDKLIVKVFEINTTNYYKKFGKEIDTDISLDGLVANSEQLVEYDQSPLLRNKRKFTFDQIKKRGVYVIDFIGGGKSSRALVRKGRLLMVGSVTTAGQRYQVVNEAGAVVVDAGLSITGRHYTADEDGNIDVPFSTRPARQNAIISQGDFSCLGAFDPVAEKYNLRATFHVDRESLAQGNLATVLIRPSLRVAGNNPIPLSRLKSATLEITSTTIDGITSTKTIEQLPVSELDEAVVNFRVPPRLSKIAFKLKGKIKTLLEKEETVSAGQQFSVNLIDSTNEIQDVHFLPTADGAFLEVLGKTGEVRAGQPVRVELKIVGLKRTVSVDLQSDGDGRVALGSLGHVQWIKATLADGSPRKWFPNPDMLHLASSYHLLADETLTLPLPAGLSKEVDGGLELLPGLVTLHEVRGRRIFRDRFELLQIKDGQLQIKGLEPGDYQLSLSSSVLENADRPIEIRVIAGTQAGVSLVGKHRILQSQTPAHPVVVEAAADEKELKLLIANATPMTRVHVFPMRYLPTAGSFDPMADLGGIRPPELWTFEPAIRRTSYMAGRKIGEEFQYILNRRYETRYPGNMLDRPSLLLNPWSVQETTNQSQSAAPGGAVGAAGQPAAEAQRKSKLKRDKSGVDGSFANLDFLGGGQQPILNLQPDKKGVVKVTAKQLAGAQTVRVVVVDAFSISQSSISKPLQKLKAFDQRLAEGLDAEKHFRQSRLIDVMLKGEALTIDDTSEYQTYDRLSDVLTLFNSFGNDATDLRKFAFVVEWMDKDKTQKQKLYSKHACHELNFFIFKKDPEFFKAVVQKHLTHKREKTFMDQWLLQEDLSNWLQPWNFNRLNVVEKILLSQRSDDRRDSLVRHVEQQYELAPTDRGRFDAWFGTAIANESLDRPQLGRFGGGDAERELLEAASDELDLDRMATGTNIRGLGGVQYSAEDGGGERQKNERLSRDLSLSRKTKSLKRQRFESRSKFDVDGKKEEDFQVPVGDSSEYFLFVEPQDSLLFRRVEPTREYIENNYWQLLPTAQNASRVTVNQFWKDYAQHKDGPFLSRWFAESNRNFTEMMFALAVLDLPMEDAKENLDVADNQVTINAAGPMIVLHQQNRETEFEAGATKLFVSENFFMTNDRYRFVGSVRHDKFVEGKFRTGVLYGSEVVITNPTSTPLAIELLVQIPQGALPASGARRTHSVTLQLNAFSTQKMEYAFYFPKPGQYTHYPAHVSGDDKILAVAEGRGFEVTDEPAAVDNASWETLSQNGSDDEVIEFLEKENVLRLNLELIAFRMKDKAFFKRATDMLRLHCRYDHTLWAYSVKHNDAAPMKEFLEHADALTGNLGLAFDSELLTVDPVTRNWFEQREYWPLINARAHRLGSKRQILNPKFSAQYEKLMRVLANRADLSSDDHLVVTWALLLQDRIEEGLNHFDRIEDKNVVASMPYAYCDAYLDLYREQPEAALGKAQKWVDYPVDHWRARFENIVAMVGEIQGGSTGVADPQSQQQQQDRLAASAAAIDLVISAGDKQGTGTGAVAWQNVDALTINYYQMDIEFLFSNNPFASDQMDGFSMIRPNATQTVALKADGKGTHEFDLPEQFANKNVLIEVIAGDQTVSKPWFAQSMNVQIVRSFGQVMLSESESKKPIAKAYVKVFSRYNNGEVKFHKDGYTDLRGRFDYVSQSNQSLDGIKDYSILIISEDHGAVIREAKPPME